MEFEWDPQKAIANLEKHGVSFDEASLAFFDPNAIEIYDELNSDDEIRFQLVAVSDVRLLFVGYTVRDDRVRITTARKANARQVRYTMSKTDKLPDYIVTEDEYKAELATGLTEDEVMKPGTYKVRRSQWAEKLKSGGKVKITIYLDGDVVEYFRDRAEQPNAAPYQTQINNELKKIMQNGAENTASVEDEILNNKKFLKALKEKLETV